jgi:hypothetical protein
MEWAAAMWRRLPEVMVAGRCPGVDKLADGVEILPVGL